MIKQLHDIGVRKGLDRFHLVAKAAVPRGG
jgi:hypothetical protein